MPVKLPLVAGKEPVGRYGFFEERGLLRCEIVWRNNDRSAFVLEIVIVARIHDGG